MDVRAEKEILKRVIELVIQVLDFVAGYVKLNKRINV